MTPNNEDGRNGRRRSSEIVETIVPFAVDERSPKVETKQEPATDTTPTFATRAGVSSVAGIGKNKLLLLGDGLAIAVLFFVFTALVGKSAKRQTAAKSSTQQGKQGVRRNVRGSALEENKRQLQRTSSYGSFSELPALEPDVMRPHLVPGSPEAVLSYRGLPYDTLEDLLPRSGAWKQAAPFLLPREDVATGRPITPLHGGHVGLLCTAGLLNGVFGSGSERHIARWRSVKHVTTFTEDEGDTRVVHHRERWTNELRLVYAEGRVLKLTETPAKPEEDTDAERTPTARAA